MDRSESQSPIDSMTTSVTIMPLPKISQWRYVGPCGRNQKSQAMQFVQEDSLDCPRPSIGKHNPLTNEVSPRLLELANNAEG
jgi:hypothetical protein